MAQKVIHVGIGTFGKRWCREFLKTNVDDGTISVVALVDIDPAALAYGRAMLGVPEARCYTDPRRAFAEVAADFCTIVVPPITTRRSSTSRSSTASTSCARSRSPTRWRGRCGSRAKFPRPSARWA